MTIPCNVIANYIKCDLYTLLFRYSNDSLIEIILNIIY